MKGTIKIIAMLLVVLTVVMVSAPVFATETKSTYDPSGFLQTIEQKANESKDNEKVGAIAAKVIALIRNLAIVIGIVMLSIIGIKYMVGSAEEKASYKKTLIPLVVGIVLVVAATSIISMVFSFATNI